MFKILYTYMTKLSYTNYCNIAFIVLGELKRILKTSLNCRTSGYTTVKHMWLN